MSKYKILVAITAAILVGGGIFYQSSQQKNEPPQIQQPASIHGVGVVDMEQILLKHPNGEKLKELREIEKRLNLELEEVMQPVEPIKPPEVNEENFKESGWQKSAQQIISQMAELQARKKNAADEYREKNRDQYLKLRNEIHDVYLNRALNIKLKLQNADNLRLSAEQIANLQNQLDEIVAERNIKQAEILQKWTTEINEYAENFVAEDMARLRNEAGELRDKYEKEAVEQSQAVQERNKTVMENAIKEIENRQQRRKEIIAELYATTKERVELEKNILDSISNEIGKLGAINRLEFIIIKREQTDSEKNIFDTTEKNFSADKNKPVGAVIYPGNDTKDLTSEVIKSIELLKKE